MRLHVLPQVFTRLGFSKHAHTVYLCLLKKGPLLATGVVRETGLYRPAVYKVLSQLIEAQLIFRIKTGKRYLLSCAPPRRIEELFVDQIGEMDRLLPKQNKKRSESINEIVTTYEGFSGLQAVFDDVVEHTKKGDTFYRYTSEQDVDVVNTYLSSGYRALRDKKRLERKVISNPIGADKKRPRLERFIKYISPDFATFTHNIIQIIYGERVAFIDINTEKAIIIKNAALADFQKVIFKQLYKKL